MKSKNGEQQLQIVEAMAARGEDFSENLCNNKYFYYIVMQTSSVKVQEWILKNAPVDSIKELMAMNPNLDPNIGLRFWSERELSVCYNLSMNQSENVAPVHQKMAEDILNEAPVGIPLFDKILVNSPKATILLNLSTSSLLDDETKTKLRKKLQQSVYMTNT